MSEINYLNSFVANQCIQAAIRFLKHGKEKLRKMGDPSTYYCF